MIIYFIINDFFNIDHIMFPIYNNNKILNKIALYYKNNENYKFSLGPQ